MGQDGVSDRRPSEEELIQHTDRPAAREAATTHPPATRARVAVALLFTLAGLTLGSWLSRVPDVKSRLGLDDDAWGLLAIGGSLGSLVAMSAVAGVIVRVGPRRLSLLAAPLTLLVAPLMASAPGPVPLAVALAMFGFSSGMLQAPMNAQAVAVENTYDRPIMSTFHACFSVGTLVGGLAGVLAVRAGAPPGAQLAGTSAALAVALLVSFRWLPPDAPVPAERPEGGGRPTSAVLLLAGIAFCSAVAEGTAAQWSAIYTSEALGAGSAAGAATYSCFAMTMVAGRMYGDRLAARLGRARFVRASALFGGVGLAAGLASGTAVGAMLGFAALGAGFACAIPSVFSLAAAQPGLAPGRSINTMAMASWPAFLVAPPLIGAVSAATSLRVALFLMVAVAAVVVVLAGRVREPAASPQGRG